MKKPIRIVNLVGARPQFIKASALSRELRKRPDLFEEIIVHSGQHYDENMSDVFFEELEIPQPQYHLGVGSSSHAEQTAKILKRVEELLLERKVDVLVVYGDTNTTLAGALAAAKLNIPVAHVEAGLRSHNSRMPEEVNRKLTDHASTWLFCPTQSAANLLKAEGISNRSAPHSPDSPAVVVTGDIMLDVARWASESADPSEYNIPSDPFILCTLHRDFNVDNPERLDAILKGMTQLSATAKVIFPVHPRTEKHITEEQREALVNAGCELVAPMSYRTLNAYLNACSLVVSDSGGLQKEAYFLQKPVVIPRPETEWVEMVQNGTAATVDAITERLVEQSLEWLNNPPSEYPPVYGNGQSAVVIVDAIAKMFE